MAKEKTKIILLSLIFLGSFSSFARNEWGNNLILFSQLTLSLIFITQGANIIIQKIKKNKSIHGSAFEHFMIGLIFLGLFFKNMLWPGANILIVFQSFFLILFYIWQIIIFFKTNFSKGKFIISLLTFGSIVTLITGIAVVFKLMHWPFANYLIYTSITSTILMVLVSLKWAFDFDGEKISIIKSLGLIKNYLILLYFACFTMCTYFFLLSYKIAPKFFSQRLPVSIEKLRENDNLSSSVRYNKEAEIINSYETFIENCEKSGVLK